jgi:phosphoglucomutase
MSTIHDHHESTNLATDETVAVVKEAKEWIACDPNPSTVRYVQTLIDTNAHEELHALFPSSTTPTTTNHRIAFGTAGLRGKMLPGPFYMNDLVVIQTAQGIASYCKSLVHPPMGSSSRDDNINNNNNINDSNNSTTESQTAKRQRTDDTAPADRHAIRHHHPTQATTVLPTSKLGVVIGYDHRATDASDVPYQLSSLLFALYTVLVFQQAGFDDVLLLDGYVATPMVPFTVVRRGCIAATSAAAAASTTTITATTATTTTNSSSNHVDENIQWIGIMITASHNPKEDAGYKIYWLDGCQIQSPTDQCIATHIQQNLRPWIDYGTALLQAKQQQQEQRGNDPCCGLSQPQRTKDIIAAYYEALVRSGLATGQDSKWDTTMSTTDSEVVVVTPLARPQFCYTAMHGVGYTFARRVFTAFGLPDFASVPIQQEPDPNFPTVTFPNPEEKGALDMAKLYATTNGCDIVLANDPDADRLAVAEKDRSSGRWTDFTGDQIGAMLGHWLWQTQSSKTPNTVLAMCASTVSSRLLSEIARVEGFYYEDTLTGFKWIGSRAAAIHNTPVIDQPHKVYQTMFCYEEAIGFCCGNIIFDKDGISALAVFAELCYSIYRNNQTICQHMQSLYDTYGEFVSNNGYYFVSNGTIVMTIMDRMTNHGKFDTLDFVGPHKVASVRYLGVPGYDSSQPDGQPTLPCSKSSPMITIRFENGCIAQFRGSGTEPKLKYYMELQGQPGVSRSQLVHELEEMSSIILVELLQPEKNGLRRTKS